MKRFLGIIVIDPVTIFAYVIVAQSEEIARSLVVAKHEREARVVRTVSVVIAPLNALPEIRQTNPLYSEATNDRPE